MSCDYINQKIKFTVFNIEQTNELCEEIIYFFTEKIILDIDEKLKTKPTFYIKILLHE